MNPARLNALVGDHLHHNFVPSIDQRFIPAAVQAIRYSASEERDMLVDLGNGKQMAAGDIVNELKLEGLVDMVSQDPTANPPDDFKVGDRVTAIVGHLQGKVGVIVRINANGFVVVDFPEIKGATFSRLNIAKTDAPPVHKSYAIHTPGFHPETPEELRRGIEEAGRVTRIARTLTRPKHGGMNNPVAAVIERAKYRGDISGGVSLYLIVDHETHRWWWVEDDGDKTAVHAPNARNAIEKAMRTWPGIRVYNLTIGGHPRINPPSTPTPSASLVPSDGGHEPCQRCGKSIPQGFRYCQPCTEVRAEMGIKPHEHGEPESDLPKMMGKVTRLNPPVAKSHEWRDYSPPPTSLQDYEQEQDDIRRELREFPPSHPDDVAKLNLRLDELSNLIAQEKAMDRKENPWVVEHYLEFDDTLLDKWAVGNYGKDAWLKVVGVNTGLRTFLDMGDGLRVPETVAVPAIPGKKPHGLRYQPGWNDIVAMWASTGAPPEFQYMDFTAENLDLLYNRLKVGEIRVEVAGKSRYKGRKFTVPMQELVKLCTKEMPIPKEAFRGRYAWHRAHILHGPGIRPAKGMTPPSLLPDDLLFWNYFKTSSPVKTYESGHPGAKPVFAWVTRVRNTGSDTDLDYEKMDRDAFSRMVTKDFLQDLFDRKFDRVRVKVEFDDGGNVAMSEYELEDLFDNASVTLRMTPPVLSPALQAIRDAALVDPATILKTLPDGDIMRLERRQPGNTNRTLRFIVGDDKLLAWTRTRDHSVYHHDDASRAVWDFPYADMLESGDVMRGEFQPARGRGGDEWQFEFREYSPEWKAKFLKDHGLPPKPSKAVFMAKASEGDWDRYNNNMTRLKAERLAEKLISYLLTTDAGASWVVEIGHMRLDYQLDGSSDGFTVNGQGPGDDVLAMLKRWNPKGPRGQNPPVRRASRR